MRLGRFVFAAAACSWTLLTGPAHAETTDWYEDDSAGQTSARLDYTEDENDPYGANRFTDVRLAITRNGTVVFNRRFKPICKYCSVQPEGKVFKKTSSVRVRDLNRDGEPEVVLNFWWGGAHCCHYSYVAYRQASGLYVLKQKTWGDPPYSLRDLDGDGVIEFQARDHRFSYAVGTAFADSSWPIRIWNFRQGKYIDVTRQHRSSVATDARRAWALYRRYRRARRDTRGTLAAYLADTYSLGKGREGRRRVRRAIRAGALRRCSYCAKRSLSKYPGVLDRFMRRTGYSARPGHASSRLCANTYGGDVISATNRLSCSKARAIVRSWARGYRGSGQANRTAYGYRCRGRNDSVEGLTVKCRRGRKVVRFYANVPR